MSKDKNLGLVNKLRKAIETKDHGLILKALEKLMDPYESGDQEFKQEVKKAFDEKSYKDTLGGTLLHKVIAYKDDGGKLTQLLIKLGCDPNAVNNNQETPLHVAALDTIKDFSKNKSEKTKYSEAKNEHKELISVLLKHEANPDLQDSKKNTPLHYLCSDAYDNIGTIELLLQSKANPTLKNNANNTAFIMAVKANLSLQKPEIRVDSFVESKTVKAIYLTRLMDLFLKAMKENSFENKEVSDALGLIVMQPSRVAKTLAKSLLEEQSPHVINRKDKEGETVLFAAVRAVVEKAKEKKFDEKKAFRLIKVLFQNHAAINIANKNNETIINLIEKEIDEMKMISDGLDKKITEKEKDIASVEELVNMKMEKINLIHRLCTLKKDLEQLIREYPANKALSRMPEASKPRAVSSDPSEETTQENQEKYSTVDVTQSTGRSDNNMKNSVKCRTDSPETRDVFFELISIPTEASNEFDLKEGGIKQNQERKVWFSASPGQSSKETSESRFHEQALWNTPQAVNWETMLLSKSFNAMEDYFLAKDECGNTPLHIAVLYSSKSFIEDVHKFITTKGFDTGQQNRILSAKNNNGESPYGMLQPGDEYSEKLLANWERLLKSDNDVNTEQGASYVRLADHDSRVISSPTTPLKGGKPNFPTPITAVPEGAGKQPVIKDRDADISWLRRLINWVSSLFSKKQTSTPVVAVTPDNFEGKAVTISEEGPQGEQVGESRASTSKPFASSRTSSNGALVGRGVYRQSAIEKGPTKSDKFLGCSNVTIRR